jgi:hypothetical protein
MAFCDSHLFDFDEEGNVVHKRSGTSYADKVIDGVRLDDSLHWENNQWHLVDGPAEGKPIVVGNKDSGKEIFSSTKSPGKERGEGKFYRKRNIPKKKKKKFPTKPKHSWHRRLSKVAQELGNLEMHTEDNASAEFEQVHYDIELEKEEKELRERNEYWSQWQEKVKDNPGSYALIELDVSVIPGDSCYLYDSRLSGDGRWNGGEQSFNCLYNMDCAGINREHEDPHGFADISKRDLSYEEKGVRDDYGDWMTEKRYYFTYWDEEVQSYTWIPLAQWWRYFTIDPYEDFDRFKEIFRLPYPGGYSENHYYYHWDDLNWENVWVYMNYLRTGDGHEYHFHKGYISYARYTRSLSDRQAGLQPQIPIIEFMTS